MLVSISQLSKSFGHKTLFKNISFGIQENEKIGIIGPNGAGKSTLLKIIAGIETQDTGLCSILNGCKIAYLPQEPQFNQNFSVLETLLENKGDLQEWEAEHKARTFIQESSLSQNIEEFLKTNINTLSGGQKKRIALGRCLLNKPDLILLDEPTNHLDLESILWCEEFIQELNCAVVTITHDRLFLDRISNKIIELNSKHQNGLLTCEGNFQKFCEKKELLLQIQVETESKLKNVLRRETEWLKRGAKARTTKQQARIQSTLELQKKVEHLKNQNKVQNIEIQFKAQENNSKKLIQIINIEKFFNQKCIIPKFNFTISNKTRLGIIGRNGAGKSTLIKLILGDLLPDTGRIELGQNVKIAFFDQSRDHLDLSLTLMKAICPTGDHVIFQGRSIHIMSYIQKFLFRTDQIDQPLHSFSGGEQARVLLAKLMLTDANLLILDEPTNDLDLETLKELETVLKEFNGGILLVSHDRYFLDQVCSQFLAIEKDELDQPTLLSFQDLFQWEEWKYINNEVISQLKSQNKTQSKNSDLKMNTLPKKIKLSFNEKRELELMESTILEIETKIEQMTLEIESKKGIELNQHLTLLSDLQKSLDTKYQRWQDLENKSKSEN